MRALLIKRIEEMVDVKGSYQRRFADFNFGDNELPVQQWHYHDFDNLDNSQLILLFEQALILLYQQG